MELEISRLNRKGRGVSGKKEVHGALPNERVTCEYGRVKDVVRPSVHRIPARCGHFGKCGGCTLQVMSYPAQLELKQRQIEALFGQADPIIPCVDPWRYRNKMEFSFSQDLEGNRYLGLMMPFGQGRVTDLSECHLVSPWFAEKLDQVRRWWEESGLPAYHHRKGSGVLRTLTLREGKRTGERLAMLTVSNEVPDVDMVVQEQICQAGSPTRFLLHRPVYLHERLEVPGLPPLTFRIGPTAFFQPNTLQAERLYAIALEGIDGDLVYDLYCGTGTIGLLAACRAKRVIGIELNPEAVEDARFNAKLNGLDNITFIAGDVGKQELEPCDTVIVDPPRAGLSPEALAHLIALGPKKIVYISCNPLTQAENIKALCEHRYHLLRVQPVDQFPHTPHIENVAFLERI